MFKTLKLALFTASAFIINVSPAFAEPITGPNVSVISTAGLDLSSAAGRAELDHRLVTAAYEVCGTPSDVDLVGKNQARACRADVLAKARAESQQLASRGSSIQIAAAR
jgi:UrcA family protein